MFPSGGDMDLSGLLRLLFLSAVWGGSFLFMRVAAPVLGPVALIEARVLSAALLLALVAGFARERLNLRAHWRPYLILGLLNSALPFLLYAHAARSLSASLLSVLNATAPMWGALVTAVWERRRPSPRTVAGLLVGLAGAALLAGLDPTALSPGGGQAVVCVLTATLCYGIATNYAKRVAGISPLNAAHGSMWTAALAGTALVTGFSPRRLGKGGGGQER
jgi:drug/metabolite transporter (DMT)-like permease